MPYCVYECPECGDLFEVMLTYEELAEEHAHTACPMCGSRTDERPAGVSVSVKETDEVLV